MSPQLHPAFPSAPVARVLIAGLMTGGLALAQGSHSAQFEARDAARMLVGSADADGNGEVSSAERDQFLATHAPTTDSDNPVLDRDALLAQSLFPFYDADGDRALTQADMDALLGRWDTDKSGDISAAERSSGPRPWVLLDGVVLKALDLNQDQAVTAEEWAPASSLDLTGWIGTTASIQEDINGFGPGTLILTLRASLDANQNGTFDREDLVQHFRVLDTNNDGIVNASELAPARAQRTRSRSYTREELNRPPAMPWQRTLEDALALSKQTGKPMLICVNADGESASERLAHGQYADPDFVRLARGFIPILASPFPHTQGSTKRGGERLECTRFGTVVCTEHINGEPLLFERYFAGQRVAPRHVGVSPEGEILFDLYLLRDLSAIDRALEEHGKFDTELPDPAQASDQELFQSTDAAFREELRKRYHQGDEALRTSFVKSAFSAHRAAQHRELVSIALYDPSANVRRAAAEVATEAMTFDTVNDAPRIRWIAAQDPALRQKLIVKLWMLADTQGADGNIIRPRRLARIYSAMESGSPIDAARWRAALAGAPTVVANSNPSDGPDLELALERVSALLSEAPDDPQLNGILAQTALRMAMRAISGEGSGAPQYLLQDAEVAAQRVIDVRPGDVLALSVLARAQWWNSKPQEAADSASQVLPALTAVGNSPEVAELLDILAKGRENTLLPALGTTDGWPVAWVQEAVSARQIQVAHPLASVEQVIAGISLLGNLELNREQAELIRSGLKRYPTSNDLHAWLRWQLLRDGSDRSRGAAALEATYLALDTPAGVEPTWLWYKGLGLRTAGDAYVEQGDGARAAAAYTASIESFEESIRWNASFEESATEHINKAREALATL